MIRFALKCENDHQFESWFQSGDAFDKLHSAKMVDCPMCGSSAIKKSLMAPRVSTPPKGQDAPTLPTQAMATGPDPKLQDALSKLRTHVEANSEYVGTKFADEATSMHLGDTPQRSIYGEVKPEDAKKLAEDGVPALPLPFIPKQKTN
ncbi:MAG: DUF1178 family protein [Boseongicola sp.]|nr:MAG: DUF1178 family protein [Boseongicola sp.]